MHEILQHMPSGSAVERGLCNAHCRRYCLCAEVATESNRTSKSELVTWLQPESRRVVARKVGEKPALVQVDGSRQPGKAPEEKAQRARVPDAKVQVGKAPAARVPAVRVQQGSPRLARAHRGERRSAHPRARPADASFRSQAGKPLPARRPVSPSAPSQLQSASSA